MSNLKVLYDSYSVSPWLDNLSRTILHDGTLQALADRGIRGVTSNPSIFEAAIKSGAYSDDYRKLVESGMNSEQAYWQLAIEDIQSACDIFKPLYESSNGQDGYVSLEVSPLLARDCDGTIVQACELWDRVNRPNVMIKIPATEECLPAISVCIAKGININVTLIFSLPRYLQVINAYFAGLEQLQDCTRVRSVASFC